MYQMEDQLLMKKGFSCDWNGGGAQVIGYEDDKLPSSELSSNI